MVGLEMCTELLAPGARSTGPKPRLPPEIAQPAASGVSLQLTPVPVGSGSLTVTPLAVPRPVLVTVTVNPIGSPALTDAASAVFVIWIVASSTLKHSVVRFVWEPARYCEAESGVYSARQQYVPAAAAVTPTWKAVEVAVPPFADVVTATGLPTCVPPLEQAPLAEGPQTKNVTVPLAGPSVPLRVAVSVTEPPKSTLEALDAVAMVGGSQVLKLPPTKSLSWAFGSCEERVSTRKPEKHGTSAAP